MKRYSYSLNLQFFSGEKTEEATPKKRQDTRKKGQVAKSQDLTTAVLLLSSFLFFLLIKNWASEKILTLFFQLLDKYLTLTPTKMNIEVLSKIIVSEVLLIVGPIFAITIAVSIVGNVGQFGFLYSTENIKLKLSKLNPIEGFKRVYSLRAIVESIKALLKLSLIGTVAFIYVNSIYREFFRLSLEGIQDGVNDIVQRFLIFGVWGSVALLFISSMDVVYQKYDYEKNIRMSKNDIRDEFKNMEGDPQVKAYRKQKQRDFALKRMMQEIPKADVVIVNPTHYAVVLKYDEEKRDSPYVVAKGVDFLAERIKKLAKEHDVTIIENKLLARSLYAEVEVGQEIPESFFKAIAEILAYVYRQKGKI